LFMRPERLAMGAGVFAFVFFLIHVPVVMLIMVLAALGWVGHRWYAGFSATGDALKKLAHVRYYATLFLRNPGGARMAATGADQ
ncbi:MAG: hypothetical protein ABI547_12090, partial [Betaproteobacteria bacterium]